MNNLENWIKEYKELYKIDDAHIEELRDIIDEILESVNNARGKVFNEFKELHYFLENAETSIIESIDYIEDELS